METLVSTQTMQQIDSKAQHDYAIPSMVLMEQAGSKAWLAFTGFAQEHSIPMTKIVFVAGGGNNGGDALVMAREAWFAGQTDISILLVGSHISHSCEIHRSICNKLGLPMVEGGDGEKQINGEASRMLADADLIVDGIAGTGLRGSLTGTTAEVVKMINARKAQGAFVLAVDIPSGCSDTMSAAAPRIMADVTITMGLQKSGAYHPVSRMGWGTILRVNPSFPPPLLLHAPAEALLSSPEELHLKQVSEDAYKYKRGHLALFAGSRRYTGAARLAARGAFHSRCGVVTLCCDQDVASVASSESPSIIVPALQ